MLFQLLRHARLRACWRRVRKVWTARGSDNRVTVYLESLPFCIERCKVSPDIGVRRDRALRRGPQLTSWFIRTETGFSGNWCLAGNEQGAKAPGAVFGLEKCLLSVADSKSAAGPGDDVYEYFIKTGYVGMYNRLLHAKLKPPFSPSSPTASPTVVIPHSASRCPASRFLGHISHLASP